LNELNYEVWSQNIGLMNSWWKILESKLW